MRYIIQIRDRSTGEKWSEEYFGVDNLIDAKEKATDEREECYYAGMDVGVSVKQGNKVVWSDGRKDIS